jgi:hypothetical protein
MDELLRNVQEAIEGCLSRIGGARLPGFCRAAFFGQRLVAKP